MSGLSLKSMAVLNVIVVIVNIMIIVVLMKLSVF